MRRHFHTHDERINERIIKRSSKIIITNFYSQLFVQNLRYLNICVLFFIKNKQENLPQYPSVSPEF